ncbi:MAG: hypothetical protein JWO69_229 [Thermoleophilia bacterium]|jgi:RimJ/RimL family protein N-acetyltransferase|nr:hypothetical protein [Thermoleophilia bacterium]
MDEIATERLVLRRWRDADLEPFAALNADVAVIEYLGGALDRVASDELVARIERGFTERGFGLWAVERRADRLFLGFTGLSVPRFEAHFTPAVEIGWRLARHAWGHGYATEGARAVLDVAFGPLDLEEVVSFTAAGNARSRAVMERIGMTHDPADDFDHPKLDASSPLRRHVLYRAAARS